MPMFLSTVVAAILEFASVTATVYVPAVWFLLIRGLRFSFMVLSEDMSVSFYGSVRCRGYVLFICFS